MRKLGEKLFKQILLKKLQMQLLGKTFFNVKLILQFDRQYYNFKLYIKNTTYATSTSEDWAFKATEDFKGVERNL